MKYQDISRMIESIGLPFAYDFFPEGKVPQPPYVVFNLPQSNDFGADNINYVSIDTLNIELYTAGRNFQMEENVETVLNQYGLFYEKTETYIRQENLYQISFVCEVITE